MNFLNTVRYGLFTGGSAFQSVQIGIEDNEITNAEPSNIGTIYLCAKILSENMGRLPFKGEKDIFSRPNNYTNRFDFLQTLELYRSTTGTAVARIHNRGKENQRFTIIDPQCLMDWRFRNGALEYYVNYDLQLVTNGNQKEFTGTEWISSDELLVFKGVPFNPAFGMSTVMAANQNIQILDKATNTLIHFYNNRCLTPLAIEYPSTQGSASRLLKSEKKNFQEENGGTQKAGSTLHLPAGAKATPISISMADAELVSTMKSSRDEITSIFGLQNYLTNENDTNKNVEQNTTELASMTISPIAQLYQDEIFHKLGIKVEFDLDVIVASDLKSKVSGWGEAVGKGLVTPEFASQKFGDNSNISEFAKMHFTQAQNIPLEHYREFQKFMLSVNDPAAKGIKDNNKPNL